MALEAAADYVAFNSFCFSMCRPEKGELQKMSECSERKLIKELFQSSSFLFPNLKVGWGTQLLFHRDLDNSQCEECKDFSMLGSLEAGSKQINEQCII